MTKLRVAVIGGGIFGVSAALELSSFCDVTVFEALDELMQVGTLGNQYRHHLGYHYPRSAETVRQCQAAEADFRSRWGSVLREDFPAYYAVAKEGSKVTAEQFLSFCDQLGLAYTKEYPDKEYLNRDAVAISVKTPEPVFDHTAMLRFAKQWLAEARVVVKTNYRVIGGRMMGEQKELTIQNTEGSATERFDAVVNAMYANFNLLPEWFGWPHADIEFRLKEIVVVRVPGAKRLAVTIMDGPFVTLVPIGQTDLFTLGDVPRSIHEVKVSSGGIPWTWEDVASRQTRFAEMKEHNPYYIPAVARAEYVQSLFTILPIKPNSDATDARPTSITYHGSGCWSVFEGKIVTCVTAAKQIANEVKSIYV